MNVARIPDELAAFDNWLVVDSEKAPVRPNGDPTDTSQLLSFEEAVSSASGEQGVAFQFSNTPYAGIDFDDVACNVSDGNGLTDSFDGLFAVIRTELCESYVEWSQSETGLHVIVRGELDDGHKYQVALQDGAHVEAYDHDRYFVLTGDTIDEFPERIADADVRGWHQEHFDERSGDTEKATEGGTFRSAASTAATAYSRETRSVPSNVGVDTVKATVEYYAENDESGLQETAQETLALWHSTPARQDGDPSSNRDASFANYLRFWCRRDRELMRRCLRRSDRCDEKWRRDDYRRRTFREVALDGDDVFELEYVDS